MSLKTNMDKTSMHHLNIHPKNLNLTFYGPFLDFQMLILLLSGLLDFGGRVSLGLTFAAGLWAGRLGPASRQRGRSGPVYGGLHAGRRGRRVAASHSVLGGARGGAVQTLLLSCVEVSKLRRYLCVERSGSLAWLSF